MSIAPSSLLESRAVALATMVQLFMRRDTSHYGSTRELSSLDGMAAFIDGEVVLPFFGGYTVIILATIPAVPTVLTEDVVRHQSALGSAASRRPPCVVTSCAMLMPAAQTNAAATMLRNFDM